ncbi:uncharacterized protein VP01_6432g1 [Puccinia sorghi]|uniref:DUF659 domain-containing protein n=1 Tax=Puccinia sorghi TaxID=27349 RepID=A0A0L6UFS6_9BASI|nr:uncharacterized protein VP01_6432g1 [Puccinia sorghi]
MKSFMAVMAHGITPDWKMIDVLIGMPAVQGFHTGSNFGNILVDVLDDLELPNKLISITTDNASSNSTLASRLLGCMAHVINLVTQDCIRVFVQIPDCQLMPSTCTQPIMLILDVQTCWNSTYSMLCCTIHTTPKDGAMCAHCHALTTV